MVFVTKFLLLRYLHLAYNVHGLLDNVATSCEDRPSSCIFRCNTSTRLLKGMIHSNRQVKDFPSQLISYYGPILFTARKSEDESEKF